jgi:hypothetical protein
MYRELKNLNSQKINDPMKTWVNELNRALSRKVQMVKKHVTIQEMQLKTTLRCHLTLVRMVIIKDTNNYKCR